jgi:hypothetical protein
VKQRSTPAPHSGKHRQADAAREIGRDVVGEHHELSPRGCMRTGRAGPAGVGTSTSWSTAPSWFFDGAALVVGERGSRRDPLQAVLRLEQLRAVCPSARRSPDSSDEGLRSRPPCSEQIQPHMQHKSSFRPREDEQDQPGPPRTVSQVGPPYRIAGRAGCNRACLTMLFAPEGRPPPGGYAARGSPRSSHSSATSALLLRRCDEEGAVNLARPRRDGAVDRG